ncbi:MAG: hypothetical protein CR964_01070 [Rhodobacterales bacterium]|nr:MAG: hypothetical protein CR964_01070 [Rhodobacterales bacterium]
MRCSGSVLRNLTDALFRLGAEEVGQATGVAIAFMRPDLDALDALKRSNLVAVGGSWNSYTSKKLEVILTQYFTEGMTREGLTQRLAEEFAGATERGMAYWEARADLLATRTREIGRISGYERAGITHVQVRAHLDARTSDICKAMHGRIISVANMRAQADAYQKAENAQNLPEMKRIWTLHDTKADLSNIATRDLKGTASPPYHFRCRTTTVAYFGPPSDDPIADLRQRVTDREPARTGDKALVRDRAAQAGFMSDKAARSKFQRHRKNLPTRKLSGYETDARALINDPDAQVLLSARVPERNKDTAPGNVALHAVFARPAPSRHTGETGYLVTVVDLEENTILSHHWRYGVSSEMDITAAQTVTKRKGFWAWLTS